MSLWGPGYFSNRLASGFGPSPALIQTVDHDVATKTYVNTITKPAALVQTITASGGTTQLEWWFFRFGGNRERYATSNCYTSKRRIAYHRLYCYDSVEQYVGKRPEWCD